MVFLLKLALIISLFFNFSLYFGWMDVGQYRAYVDWTIQDVKDITASEEFQNLKNMIKDKFASTYNENLWESNLNAKLAEIQDSITEFWVDAAVEKLTTKYPELWKAEIQEMVDAAVELQKASLEEEIVESATNTAE